MSKKPETDEETDEETSGTAEKTESEGEEVTFESILAGELADLDKQLKELNGLKNDVKTATNAVLQIVYAPVKDGEIPEEFAKPDEFRMKLDALHDYMGLAVDYVLRLEKQRGVKFSESEETSEEKEPEKPALPGPIITVTSPSNQTPQPPAQRERTGPFAYFLEKDARDRAERREREEREAQQQPVVSSTRIIDIVEFGRQLQPAFNKIKRWMSGTLARMSIFPNDSVYFVKHEELACFLSQTLGSLITWVNACLEYRKNLIQGRKLGLWRSVAKIVESQAGAPTMQVGGTMMPDGMKFSRSGFEARKNKS